MNRVSLGRARARARDVINTMSLSDVETFLRAHGCECGVVRCLWCDNGDEPVRLDENGVAAEDGTLSHTSSDSWWPCEVQGRGWIWATP